METLNGEEGSHVAWDTEGGKQSDLGIVACSSCARTQRAGSLCESMMGQCRGCDGDTVVERSVCSLRVQLGNLSY